MLILNVEVTAFLGKLGPKPACQLMLEEISTVFEDDRSKPLNTSVYRSEYSRAVDLEKFGFDLGLVSIDTCPCYVMGRIE